MFRVRFHYTPAALFAIVDIDTYDCHMNTQVAPSKNEMEHYLDMGLTHQQIVEAWEKDTGVRISRSTISMAIGRYGLTSANARPRYEELLPWRVRREHLGHADARMLRLEGRRRAGGSLSEEETRWLEKWKTALFEQNAVVFYDPRSPSGFHWIDREPRHGDELIDRPETSQSIK